MFSGIHNNDFSFFSFSNLFFFVCFYNFEKENIVKYF